jgi:hypothetical protein
MYTEKMKSITLRPDTVTHTELYLICQVLFSCGADGSMFAFDVEGLVGQEMQVSKETTAVADPRMASLGGGGARSGGALLMFASARHFNSAAVLCSREEVANSMAQITDMTKRIEDMRAETGYTLHRMETEWQEKMRLQTDKMEEGLTVERVRRRACAPLYGQCSSVVGARTYVRHNSHCNSP